MMRSALVLGLVLLVPGCIHWDPPSEEAPRPSAAPAPAPSRDADRVPAPFVAAPPLKRGLAVSLRVADDWVRPGEPIDASADAPAHASLSWYLASKNPLTAGDGRDARRWPGATLPPGGAAAGPRFDDAGRFVLSLAGTPALLNVTVSRNAFDGGAIEVVLADDAKGLRFAPEDLDVRPGTRLAFRNLASTPATVAWVEDSVTLSFSGPDARFPAPSLMGDYDLVLVARAPSGGHGEARERLIIDSRKPHENVSFGPWRGRLDAPLPDAPERTHLFSTRHDLATLVLRWTAEAAVGDASVAVRLEGPGERVLARDEGRTGELRLDDLPAGDYWLSFAPRSGALIDYEADAAGRLALRTPASFFAD